MQMTKTEWPTVIIPAFEPDWGLYHIVKAILGGSKLELIIINDGSRSNVASAVFQEIKDLPRVRLISHATNLGKGAALKSGIAHYLQEASPNSPGVVCADADGQHLPQDIISLANNLRAQPNRLILGSRVFTKEVPWRSRFGNHLTSLIFKIFFGSVVSDTQTGLRGITKSFLPNLLEIDSNGYEFELEMLVAALKEGIELDSIRIETVYEEGNKSSHFNPIIDSLKIYFVFFRFLALSLVTTLIGYTAFSLSYFATKNIFESLVLSRVTGGLFNFIVAKNLVFRSKKNFMFEALKYCTVVALMMSISYALVNVLMSRGVSNVYVAMMSVECGLFLLSFAFQDRFVFHRISQAKAAVPQPQKTDWNKYYTTHKTVASVTRKVTQNSLLRTFEAFHPEPQTICEIGGANSCFYKALRKRYPGAEYSIIDNNGIGLELFRKNHPNDANVALYYQNIIEVQEQSAASDIVFSVGLIEHFSQPETHVAITRHFEHAKPGGIVIMTFPTPTLLYRVTRYWAEVLGIWRFPDERPLSIREVIDATKGHGEVLNSFINWKTILTQGVVVARVIRSQQSSSQLNT